MLLPPRSLLYVPGDRAEMLSKALASDADVVIADLEDAVPADRRDTALANVIAALAEGSPRLHVRVPAADAGVPMLRALARSSVTMIRLAKTDTADDALRAAHILDETGAPPAMSLSCLLESALAIEHAFAIAIAHPRVAAIAVGESDLMADLGVSDGRGLLYARTRVVVAARAAGLPSPVQSVHTDVGDLEGLRATCAEGRALGFHGRSVVHPRQIPIVNEEYGLTAQERERAQALADVASRVSQVGALLLDDGRLADPATVAQAQALLRRQR